LISFNYFRWSRKNRKGSSKTSHSRRRYSRLWVHGLVPLADDLEPLAAVLGDLHLVSEAHVVGHVLARLTDVVGDLIDLVALLAAG
jgi:hypothetical protein